MKIGNFTFKSSKEQTRLIDLLPKTKDDSCFFDYLQSRLKHLTIEIVKKDPYFFYAKFIEKNTVLDKWRGEDFFTAFPEHNDMKTYLGIT